MFRAILAAALMLLPSTAIASTATLYHEQNSIYTNVAVPGSDYKATWQIDTGADITMVSNDDIIYLALIGKAHMIGQIGLVGVDGVPNPYPIYVLDSLSIGDCTLVNSIDNPILVVAGDGSLLGGDILKQLGNVTFGENQMVFTCPAHSGATGAGK